ncbi:hypothetical protein BS47DRAFT_1396753 [Hydnum rufescens UP504]|uniref:Uncharacterized protein n=1 Tax=Hydnum rufescens UP504 TaxID=1448309 RepID=A0A9P6DP38_9AGAM|nr:hypothetical protein BS47DRAFT_1396753 [Hydnum rufescens UP504]
MTQAPKIEIKAFARSTRLKVIFPLGPTATMPLPLLLVPFLIKGGIYLVHHVTAVAIAHHAATAAAHHTVAATIAASTAGHAPHVLVSNAAPVANASLHTGLNAAAAGLTISVSKTTIALWKLHKLIGKYRAQRHRDRDGTLKTEWSDIEQCNKCNCGDFDARKRDGSHTSKCGHAWASHSAVPAKGTRLRKRQEWSAQGRQRTRQKTR